MSYGHTLVLGCSVKSVGFSLLHGLGKEVVDMMVGYSVESVRVLALSWMGARMQNFERKIHGSGGHDD